MNRYYNEDNPEFTDWQKEDSKGNRRCFYCNAKIKENNPCFRQYYPVMRISKEHGDVPSSAYHQCCLICGLYRLVELRNWANKQLDMYKVYTKKGVICKEKVEDTHTPITGTLPLEAVGSSPRFIKV